MKKVIKSFKFWFAILGIALMVVYLIANNGNIMKVIEIVNIPLFALLNLIGQSVLQPLNVGITYTPIKALMLRLPFAVLYVLSFFGYGVLIDLLIKAKKTSKK